MTISKTRTANYKITDNDTITYYRADEVESAVESGNWQESPRNILDMLQFDSGKGYMQSIAMWVYNTAEPFRTRIFN